MGPTGRKSGMSGEGGTYLLVCLITISFVNILDVRKSGNEEAHLGEGLSQGYPMGLGSGYSDSILPQ